MADWRTGELTNWRNGEMGKTTCMPDANDRPRQKGILVNRRAVRDHKEDSFDPQA